MTRRTVRRTRRRAALVTAGLVGSVALSALGGFGSADAAPGDGSAGIPGVSVPPVLALPRPTAHPEAPSGPNTLFVGDYDTGSFGQWGTCQSVAINSSCSKVKGSQYSMQMMPTPAAREGPFAAKFEIHPGDVPNFGGGERTEVSSDAPGALTHEGDERWYHWSMYLPPDFPTPRGNYFIVMQWHAGNKNSPPLAVLISKKGTVDVGGDGVDAQSRKPHTIGPVRRGQWVDYAMHVGFSRTAGKGFVEAWENGAPTVPRYSRATMADDENYLKQGIYRNADGQRAVVWLDGLRVTGPAGRSSEARHHAPLCSDAVPRGTACLPPD